MNKKREQHLGLVVIVATLLVISVISVYLLISENKHKLQDVRGQGTALTRMLARIPFAELSRPTAQNGALQVLRLRQNESALAYAVVTDTTATQVTALVAPGVIVPEYVPRSNPSTWLSEDEITLSTGAAVIEFTSPVLDNSEVIGFVRTAFFKPTLMIDPGQLSLLAGLALPIFLLAPLFFYLMRRELKPLNQASERLAEAFAANLDSDTTLAPSEELSDFISQFNAFVERTQHDARALADERLISQTTNRMLSYNTRRIQTALESMPDGVLVMDDTGDATFVSTKVRSIIGIAGEEILHKKPEHWCSDKDVAALLARYHGNVSRLQRADRIEFTPASHPDRTIVVTAYPLFAPNESNVILGTLVVFRDITADCQAKSARDDFISHAAHELKSPLQVISMYAETLFDSAHGDAEQTEAANIIHDQTERLGRIISDLLNITRLEAGNVTIDLQRIKTDEFLRDTFASATKGAAAAGINVDLLIPNDIPALFADKDLLRIALNNLISNALKYSDQGGVVTVEAEEHDETIVIQISDTGIGISEEDQQSIFEKFFRSENDAAQERPGHGLGLPLAREIIQLHNGHLSLESEIGKGTTFFVTLGKTNALLKAAS